MTELTTLHPGLLAALLVLSGGSFGIAWYLARFAFTAQRGISDAALNAAPVSLRDADAAVLTAPPGRLRACSVCGLIGNLIRHHDGSYTKAYQLQLAPSYFGPDEALEQRADELARCLGGAAPPGVTFQFRFNVTPGGQTALKQHLRSMPQDGGHALAGLLHASSLDYFARAVESGAMTEKQLSLWVRVPAAHSRDTGPWSQFLPGLRRFRQRLGWRALLRHLRRHLLSLHSSLLLSRYAADEQEALRQAEKVWAAIEAQFPNDFALAPLTRREVWAALYRSHRQEAESVPRLPATPGRDLRDYLCGETISGAGRYLRHGPYPVSLVTLTVPPQPVITADLLRLLTANPKLNFRYTLLTEFVTLDQKKIKGQLESRIRRARRSANTLLGAKTGLKHDAQAALHDVNQLLAQVESGKESLIEARVTAVIYGPRVASGATDDEWASAAQQLDDYCERILATLRRLPGADAIREEPACLRALYPRTLAGEAGPSRTGREIPEVASSLAALVPGERNWPGCARPHSIFATPSGQLFGLDLLERSLIKSPTVIITAASGEGKSVLGGRLINDLLAHRRRLRVKAVDYKRSLAPLVQLLQGRHLTFDDGTTRALNIWNYPGLAHGQSPSKTQEAFVLGDLLLLARIPPDDALAHALLKTLIQEVYRTILPKNGPGRPKIEPRLTHLLDLCRSYHWQADAARNRAEQIYLALQPWRNDPLLDAPTHPDFDLDSPFDVFELDSLAGLDETVRASLAYRIAVQVMHAMGQRDADGQLIELLLVFDEMNEITKHYPAILEVIERATTTGRKDGVVTLLLAQAYEQLAGSAEAPNPIATAIVKNAGVKFIGKQIGNYDKLAADAELSPAAVAAIKAIKNQPGHNSQWLAVIGSGTSQLVEMCEVYLSSAELWAFTTDPNERNARAVVQNWQPHWPAALVVNFLATHYPRGLTAAGLTEIESHVLDEIRPRQAVSGI